MNKSLAFDGESYYPEEFLPKMHVEFTMEEEGNKLPLEQIKEPGEIGEAGKPLKQKV